MSEIETRLKQEVAKYNKLDSIYDLMAKAGYIETIYATIKQAFEECTPITNTSKFF
jgi:hypothetical protein